MAANANDVFMEVGQPGTATTLSSPGYTSGVSTSVNVGSTTNWPTNTGIIFAIDEATTNAAGEEVRVDGTYNEFEGTVASATSITNVDYVAGDAERSYSAGATTRVYIPVSATRENRLAQGMAVEHSQLDGTHTDITPDSISVANNIDVVDAKAIRDGNDNELIKFSQTTSAVNEITVKNAATGSGAELQATGGDTNIDVELVPKGTGRVTNGTQKIDTYAELGRTTLGSEADAITVSSLPARTHLKILFYCLNNGSINAQLRFNNDTAGNYAYNSSIDSAASSTAVSQTEVQLSASGTSDVFGYVEVINIAADAKSTIHHSTRYTGAASSAPSVLIGSGVWANTADQITRVDIVNSSTGGFVAGSKVIVLGHD